MFNIYLKKGSDWVFHSTCFTEDNAAYVASCLAAEGFEVEIEDGGSV